MNDRKISGGNYIFPQSKSIYLAKEVLDSCGNKNVYRYNLDGRMTQITCKKAEWTNLANADFSYGKDGKLLTITRDDGCKYSFSYDEQGRLIAIYEGDLTNAMIEYRYPDYCDCPEEIVYANGARMRGVYNNLGQLVEEFWYNYEEPFTPEEHYLYTYNSDGHISKVIDYYHHREYVLTYNGDHVIRSTEHRIVTNSAGEITDRIVINTISYAYDNNGDLVKKHIIPSSGPEQFLYYETDSNGGNSVKTTFNSETGTCIFSTQRRDNVIYESCRHGDFSFSRSMRQFDPIFIENPESVRADLILFSDGRQILYNLEGDNKITSTHDTQGEFASYVYGTFGQLILEVQEGEAVCELEYDNYGNILEKDWIPYTYDSIHKDRLISVGESPIFYDSYGCPIVYLGHRLSWGREMRLERFDDSFYSYNAFGQRIEKTVDGILHTYIWEEDTIIQESWENHTIVPLYNNGKEIYGVLHDDKLWFFQKNLHGDVLSILDPDKNTVVAAYRYDAWGKCEIRFDKSGQGIASVNPFRYRGYYYDCESGFYYVCGRYYDPNISRFLDPENPLTLCPGETIVDYNLYAYCRNDPIHASPKTGK